jgi:hypothetical protein
MGTAEGWAALLGSVAAIIVEVAEASERRADGQGVAVCSLCRDLSSSLFPVSRGRLCPTCIAVAHLELVKDWRKLKEENEQLRTLFREFDAAGMSLKQVVEAMTNIVADLKIQTAANEMLRQAASAAEDECRTARATNTLLRAQVEAAQREAESLQNELVAVQREKAAAVAESGAPGILAEIKLLLHPRIFEHILDLASSSASSAMAKSIEAFLKSLMLAALQRMDALEGPSLQVIEALQKAGYLHPDGYSGRVLAWLVRRTPLVTRTVGNPVVYAVHLDWFFRPPPECLDHHQLRRR